MRRRILMVLAGSLAAGTAAAQAPAANDMAAALRQGFDEVNGWITRAADMVPADKYGYRPTDGVRTFGQLIAHVADGQNYYCARAAGRPVEWSDAVEQGGQDKATVVQKLKESTVACAAAHARAGTAPPLVANIAHDNLHYGNIITYMRMLGLTPPSS
jgi:uncharacterized damage-inducible protein DinB